MPLAAYPTMMRRDRERLGRRECRAAWLELYRSEPLPGFGGQTAMQLVRDGKADEVLEMIDAVDAGVHA